MLGLGQACRSKAKSNEQLGAKSPDRDLGDVHTWPHSHYLMRQCDGVGGWVQLKYRLCRCRCGCENVQVQKDAKCAGAKSTIKVLKFIKNYIICKNILILNLIIIICLIIFFLNYHKN